VGGGREVNWAGSAGGSRWVFVLEGVGGGWWRSVEHRWCIGGASVEL
jgi:hypothetical protein